MNCASLRNLNILLVLGKMLHKYQTISADRQCSTVELRFWWVSCVVEQIASLRDIGIFFSHLGSPYFLKVLLMFAHINLELYMSSNSGFVVFGRETQLLPPLLIFPLFSIILTYFWVVVYTFSERKWTIFINWLHLSLPSLHCCDCLLWWGLHSWKLCRIIWKLGLVAPEDWNACWTCL